MPRDNINIDVTPLQVSSLEVLKPTAPLLSAVPSGNDHVSYGTNYLSPDDFIQLSSRNASENLFTKFFSTSLYEKLYDAATIPGSNNPFSLHQDYCLWIKAEIEKMFIIDRCALSGLLNGLKFISELENTETSFLNVVNDILKKIINFLRLNHISIPSLKKEMPSDFVKSASIIRMERETFITSTLKNEFLFSSTFIRLQLEKFFHLSRTYGSYPIIYREQSVVKIKKILETAKTNLQSYKLVFQIIDEEIAEAKKEPNTYAFIDALQQMKNAIDEFVEIAHFEVKFEEQEFQLSKYREKLQRKKEEKILAQQRQAALIPLQQQHRDLTLSQVKSFFTAAACCLNATVQVPTTTLPWALLGWIVCYCGVGCYPCEKDAIKDAENLSCCTPVAYTCYFSKRIGTIQNQKNDLKKEMQKVIQPPSQNVMR